MNSDQLDLWPKEVSRIPWRAGGPRAYALTKFPKVLFLRREPQKDVSEFADPDQYDFWLRMRKAPWTYQGAPLLREV